MERLRAIVFWLSAFAVISFFLAIALSGCAVTESPQPTFYSPDEKHIMFIPKGTQIGDIVAPEDGIFIGKSKIIDMHIINRSSSGKAERKHSQKTKEEIHLTK